jgi:hypothetical protein
LDYQKNVVASKDKEVEAIKRSNLSLQLEIDKIFATSTSKEELGVLLKSKDEALDVLGKANRDLEQKVSDLEAELSLVIETLEKEQKNANMSFVLKHFACYWELLAPKLEPLFEFIDGTSYPKKPGGASDLIITCIFGFVSICIFSALLNIS